MRTGNHRTVSIAGLLLLAGLASATPPGTGDEPGNWVVFQGKRFHSSDPPERVGPWTVRAIREWADWSRENDYELFLNDDQRFLLVVSGKKRSDEMKLAVEALGFVDELIRPPAEAPRTRYVPPGTDPATVEDGDPLGAATMVLLRVEDEEDMVSVASHVAGLAPHLGGWAAAAETITSFRLQTPLVAGWLVLPEGLEENEYQPENELVHNVVRLGLFREYGPLPNWLANGLAWYVEEELRSSVFCMPNRDTFVPRKEHRTWERRLRDLHEDREEPLRIEELAALAFGTWDGDAALRAWGTARYLALHRPEAVPAVLEDLRGLWERKSIEVRPDGSWRRVAGFEVSPEDQLAVLVGRAGPDVLEEINRFCRKGRTYRP